MRHLYITICLSFFVLSGCTGKISVHSDVIENNGELKTSSYAEHTSLKPAASIDKNLQRELNTGDTVEMPNPYKGLTETTKSWRYEVFEIFRGAQEVELNNTLKYELEYSKPLRAQEGDLSDLSHEFVCQITLPQYTGNEPWTEQLNAYYQELMPQLVTEGSNLWNEYMDDPYARYLIYEYTSGHKYENIITVVRSRAFGGWRPSRDCIPFADLFSALDGKILSLDDLFWVDRDVYLPALHSSLMNATMCFSDGYVPEHAADFEPVRATEYMEQASVAVTPFGLVFIYPTGWVSSTATGNVFLNVAYEDLRGLLNPLYFPEERVGDG